MLTDVTSAAKFSQLHPKSFFIFIFYYFVVFFVFSKFIPTLSFQSYDGLDIVL